MARARLLLLVLLWLLPAAAVEAARIVAVGDVHGEIDGFDSVLRAAALTDSDGRWVGGDAILVQTGDLTDRGPRVRQVMDRLRALEQQAPAQGGRVVPLLGNHEVSNLVHLFDEQSTPAEIYHQIWSFFAGDKAERRQKAAHRQWYRWLQRYPGCVKQENGAWREDREAWLADHPPGFIEYIEALSPGGEYGRWLRGLDIAAEIDGVIFVHGGLSGELVESGYRSVAALNRAAAEALAQLDADRQQLVDEKLIVPFSSLWEMHCALFVEMARLEESGKPKALARKAELETLRARLPGMPGWFLTSESSPLWFRGLANGDEATMTAELDGVLAAFGAERIAMGHTPQLDGAIRLRFGGRVYLIDTAMAYPELGGRAAALEIDGDRVTAVYADERVPLTDAPAPVAGTSTEPVEGASGPPVEGTNGHGDEAAESLGGRPVEGTNGQPSEFAGGQEPGPPEAAPGEPEPAAAVAVEAPEESDPQVDPAAEPVWLGADGEPLPFTTLDEVLDFLTHARVVRSRRIETGVTLPRQLLLERDGVRAHAIFHDISVDKQRERLRGGKVVTHFRDHYANNIAAFELSRLLGMTNVPPAVERRIGRNRGSVQLWIENATTEAERRQRGLPSRPRYGLSSRDMWVFDNLINNIDRNQGNMLYDGDWNLWLIDHTRAFGRDKRLPEPKRITRCSRRLWRALQELDEEEVRRRLGPHLGIWEIGGVLARRQLLIELIEERIATYGEMYALFDYGAPPIADDPEPDIPAPPPGR